MPGSNLEIEAMAEVRHTTSTGSQGDCSQETLAEMLHVCHISTQMDDLTDKEMNEASTSRE